MKTLSRKALFKKTGFPMTNHNWAWGGVNHEEKEVLITAWIHYTEKVGDDIAHLFFSVNWKRGGASDLGYNDTLELIRLVEEEGYQLNIAIAEPTTRFSYPTAKPDEEVKIKRMVPSFYFICDLKVISGDYFAIPRSKHYI